MPQVRELNRTVRTLAAVVLMLTVLVGLPSAASADTGLEVSVPTELVAGKPATFVVELTADQAVTGTLSVRFEDTSYYQETVEVPGGSTKQFVLVTSAPPWSSLAAVVFEPDSGQRKVARINLTDPTTATDQVAVFPSLSGPGMPTTVETMVSGVRATTHRFDPALLRAGSEVLAPVGTVMMTADDFAVLDADQLMALRIWLVNGGVLLFDGTADGLPEALVDRQRITDNQAWVGQGTVRLVENTMADGLFDDLVVPTVSNDQAAGGPVGFSDPSATVRTLAQDSGISVLQIMPIILFLIVYILVVGPVLWLVLRSMNRQPLFWLAVPVLALGVTVGIWLVGRAQQSAATGAHATLVVDDNALSTTRTKELVFTRSGGFVGVTLDDGWRPTAEIVDPWNEFGPANQNLSSTERRGDAFGMDVAPASLAVVGVTRNQEAVDSPWTINIDGVDDQTLTGTLTNNTEHDLSGVVVAVGPAAAAVESAGPGESVEFTLNLGDGTRPASDMETGQDELTRRVQRSETDAPVNAGLFLDWRATAGLGSSSVVAVGWTDQLPSPVDTTDGKALDNGRTGFVTVTNVQDATTDPAVLRAFPSRSDVVSRFWQGDPGSDDLLDGEGVAELVYGPASAGPPGRAGGAVASAPAGDGTAGDGTDDAVVVGVTDEELSQVPQGDVAFNEESFVSTYRFELRPGLGNDQLAITARNIGGLDYWDGTEWAPSGIGSAGAVVDEVNWAIPAAAINDGVVLVRVWDDWSALVPILTVPEGSDELAWTVGG